MQLNYKKLGEGQPIIILHGLFGSLDNWMTFGKKWSENYQVYLVDQRNHGQSPHQAPFDYPTMANDLAKFMKEERIINPLLIGHSMGGKTVMEYAVNHPATIKKAIVVDIAPVAYEVHHYAVLEALNAVSLEKISSRSEADRILSDYLKEVGVRQFLLKNLYWKEKGKLAWRFNLSLIENEIVTISKFDISPKQYKGSILFIKGENSPYILAEHAAAIHEKFPNYQLEVIPNTGHWVHAEAPQLFFDVCTAFMKD